MLSDLMELKKWQINELRYCDILLLLCGDLTVIACHRVIQLSFLADSGYYSNEKKIFLIR